MLELLIVPVNLGLTIILHILNFLNEVLHEYVDFTSCSVRFLLECSEKLVAEDHLLFNRFYSLIDGI